MNIKSAASVLLSGALVVLPKIAAADDFMVCARHAIEINNPGAKGVALGEEAQFLARSFPNQEEGGLQARSGIAVVGDRALFFVESGDESVLVMRALQMTPDSTQSELVVSSKAGTSSAFRHMMEKVAENMERDFSACAARTGQNNTVEPSPFHKMLAEKTKARMEQSVERYAEGIAAAANAKQVLKGYRSGSPSRLDF